MTTASLPQLPGPANLGFEGQPHLRENAKRPSGTKLTLRGTGAAIEDVKLLEPCYADTPIEEIRRRYNQDGVVWVGLLPPCVRHCAEIV